VEKPRYTGDLVSGEKRPYTYAGIVGSRTLKTIGKQFETEPVVPPISESVQGSVAILASESNFQTTPKIRAESKIRHLLTIFSKPKPSQLAP
jgi:hypothetical protein